MAWHATCGYKELARPRPCRGVLVMDRRKFIRTGLVGGSAAAVGAVAAPNIVTAQARTFSWKMTNAYGPGAPFYVQGPGSPTDFIRMVDAMSQGRLKIQHFAAGELIPALEGFGLEIVEQVPIPMEECNKAAVS